MIADPIQIPARIIALHISRLFHRKAFSHKRGLIQIQFQRLILSAQNVGERMNDLIYPYTFDPVYKDYPWGGTRIPERFNRSVPPGIYAESWEIAEHNDGMSVVSNGPQQGRTLRELVQQLGPELLGTHVKGPSFPLLIKLIDAKEKLSVQVHPNDQTAAQFGGEAKTEMWYLLGRNQAQVFCELKEGVTRESFIEAIEQGTSGETLHPIDVEKGDAIFVRGGRVHAIGEGCLILEIQQNSNTTYRIYDWDRMGNDGKPRELHIEQALNVINWNDHENPRLEPKCIEEAPTHALWEILQCEYFRLEKLIYSAPQQIELNDTTFHALFCAEGQGELQWGDNKSMPLEAGTSVLIPAALPHYRLTGNATLLRTTIPH